MTETQTPGLLKYEQILTLGCDPEFFFLKNGEVMGAEKVLPKEGISSLKLDQPREHYVRTMGEAWTKQVFDASNISTQGGFVIDGVQVELNPRADRCRALIGNNIAACFRSLRSHLQAHPGVATSFDAVVEVTKTELDSLSERARVLGCAPSLNLHDQKATVSVNASTYRKRSAGGHIHLGGTQPWLKTPDPTVRVLDVLLGNTCVLLDRNPDAVERRKVYGRAGEYRLPKHGLEYRTLSNFWLRSWQLTSMVFGLARMAGNVMEGNTNAQPVYRAGRGYIPVPKFDFAGDLLKRIDQATVTAAINQNDADLARVTWDKVKEFVQERVGAVEEGLDETRYLANSCRGGYGVHPLATNLLPDIEHFIDKGLDYWFKEDPVEHWCSKVETHREGWEAFLINVVRQDRLGLPALTKSLQ